MADVKINYPSQEWLDKWIDRYCDQHPDERITDFDALKEQAEQAWWDNEIDHDRPTPFDLTAEQKKVAHEARTGIRAVNAFGKEVKRVRKPNEVKRSVMASLLAWAQAQGLAEAVLSNPERALDFTCEGKHYTLTLTEHRPPKSK